MFFCSQKSNAQLLKLLSEPLALSSAVEGPKLSALSKMIQTGEKLQFSLGME
jgi:hypothetical protein